MNVPATPDRVHVLMVERKAASARLAIEALNGSTVEYGLTVVADAAAALNHLHARRAPSGPPLPDFIFLDLELPGRSGHLILADLQADERLREIPVLAMARANRNDLKRLQDAHWCCCITKPTTVEEFASVVNAIEQLWLPTVMQRRNGKGGAGGVEE